MERLPELRGSYTFWASVTSYDRPFPGADNHSTLMGRLSLPVLRGLHKAGPQENSAQPEAPGTRLGDKGQEELWPGEACPLRLSCTGSLDSQKHRVRGA